MPEFAGLKVRFSVSLRRLPKDFAGPYRQVHEIGKDTDAPLWVVIAGFAAVVTEFYARTSDATAKQINAQIKRAGAAILQIQATEKT